MVLPDGYDKSASLFKCLYAGANIMALHKPSHQFFTFTALSSYSRYTTRKIKLRATGAVYVDHTSSELIF